MLLIYSCSLLFHATCRSLFPLYNKFCANYEINYSNVNMREGLWGYKI